MKHILGWKRILAFGLGILVPVGAWAGEVKLRQVEPDLGDALGFGIYRFEANLNADEWLVVEEHDGFPEERESVFLYVSRMPSYRVTLVDSGMLHPSLRGTIMLRYANHDGYLNDVRLARTEIDVASLLFAFAPPLGNETIKQQRWVAYVVDAAEFAEKWPSVTTPKLKDGSASRYIWKMEGELVDAEKAKASAGKP